MRERAGITTHYLHLIDPLVTSQPFNPVVRGYTSTDDIHRLLSSPQLSCVPKASFSVRYVEPRCRNIGNRVRRSVSRYRALDLRLAVGNTVKDSREVLETDSRCHPGNSKRRKHQNFVKRPNPSSRNNGVSSLEPSATTLLDQLQRPPELS